MRKTSDALPFVRRSEFPGVDTRAGEQGYLLVAVVVMVALVLIALSVAAPIVAKQIRREKEVESEHRAQQYVRAIRLYYRKTNAYPPSLDALKQSSNIRFLRHEYVDPLTGKADWRLIHYGEQKTTVKGFFGQELGGLAAGGLGSASGLNSGVGTPIGGSSTSSTIGATSALSSGFQGATISGNSPGSTSGSFGAFGATGGTGSTGSTGSTGGTGALGGGGPIVGVGTAATGNSLSTPNKQTTYETWEFWYDPRIEQLYQKGRQNAGIGSGALGSTSASSFGTNLNGQSNGAAGSTGAAGSGFGSSSFGSSSFGSSSFGGSSASGFGSSNAPTAGSGSGAGFGGNGTGSTTQPQ